MYQSLTRVRRDALYIIVVIATLMMIFGNIALVSAADITSGSVELSDPRTTATSSYTVSGASFSGTLIRCVAVQLDSQADGGGGIPLGINTTSTLDSSTLITAGNWNVDNSTNGTLRITSVAGETPSASGNIVWAGVTNGSVDQTYYGLVTTYTDASCTGGNEVDSTVLGFAYKDGTLVSLTLEPTLLFTVSAVTQPDTVNLATLTVDSTATGIDHGTAVTTAANGISAHDLGVTTNASGGYNVYIRDTGPLTNESSNTIALHAGTNAAPVVFTAAGTEGWGYTTEDADLVQFVGNLWAGFTTSNELVMTNAAATAGSETSRVGHQVGVAVDTPAGTYETTMIYTIVATY